MAEMRRGPADPDRYHGSLLVLALGGLANQFGPWLEQHPGVDDAMRAVVDRVGHDLGVDFWGHP